MEGDDGAHELLEQAILVSEMQVRKLRHRVDALSSEARAVGLSPELNRFREGYGFLADLARLAEKANKK